MDAVRIPPNEPFQVGEWLVDPDSGRIQRGGEAIKLEPKVMSVLVCLVQNAGRVVSREQLEATVWAGTVVGYDAVAGSVIKLRKALGDDSRSPRFIETVSKKGYRLIADVGVAAVDQPSPTPRRFNAKWMAAAAVLAAAVAVWLAWAPGPTWLPDRSGSSPDGQHTVQAGAQPSIVVLPFANLSNDPNQDYFSDGITDDIITDLAQVGALHVVARQSSYYFKGQTVGAQEVGRELGVQYILDGSVQTSGDRLRINVQLTNVENGLNIWAERFDRTINNIFEIQDEISHRIVEALSVRLSDQEKLRVGKRTTDNFEAYDNFLRGQRFIGSRSREDWVNSVEAYKRAIEFDPNYARAFGALAVAYTFGYRYQWTDMSDEDALNRALALATRATSLDQSNPPVYWSLGFVHLFRREFSEAEAAARRCVELSPSYADGYGLLAFVSNLRGKNADAVRYIRKATDLNPFHTFDYPWNLGLAYYNLGRYSEATVALQDALERNPSATMPRVFLAASFVRLGRVDDAQWEMEQIRVQRPELRLSNFDVSLPIEHPEQLRKVLDDLRIAGLPG